MAAAARMGNVDVYNGGIRLASSAISSARIITRVPESPSPFASVPVVTLGPAEKDPKRKVVGRPVESPVLQAARLWDVSKIVDTPRQLPKFRSRGKCPSLKREDLGRPRSIELSTMVGWSGVVGSRELWDRGKEAWSAWENLQALFDSNSPLRPTMADLRASPKGLRRVLSFLPRSPQTLSQGIPRPEETKGENVFEDLPNQKQGQSLAEQPPQSSRKKPTFSLSYGGLPFKVCNPSSSKSLPF